MKGEPIIVYGAYWCPDCRRAKQFLSDQRVPFEWIDLDERPDEMAVVREKNDGKQILPTIIFPDGSVLAEPSNSQLAVKLGLQIKARHTSYELIIVGGGPAGLTAAIYAARENIVALLMEKGSPGGQIAWTGRVDNYPGFPRGILGSELADRMAEQARRCRIEMLCAVEVSALEPADGRIAVVTDQSDRYLADAVLVAVGNGHRKLGAPGEAELLGAGVHYCATCDGPFYKGAEELMVVGGGNSGLQEALFLSRFAGKVRIVEREPELSASHILREKVAGNPKFVVDVNTEVLAFEGKGKLDGVRVRDRASGQERRLHPAAVFVLVGRQPNTDFLKGALELDEQGFVVTRDGYETSLPGVFAAGDGRAGSTKQLGAAVGEAVSAMAQVRHYLEQRGLA